MDKRKTDSIRNDVQYHFGFLDTKGFRIHTVEYAPLLNGNWMVELESPICVIFITNDRNHLLLEFAAKHDPNVKNRITLERTIYEISRGRIIVEPFKGNVAWGKKKQLERLSSLLANHINEILPCFQNENGTFSVPVQNST